MGKRGGKRKPASRAQIELNRKISACGSAGEVCACIEAAAAGFNYVNVATAFRKLLTAKPAGVPHGVMGSAKRKLEEAALGTMADFQAQETSNTLHVIAKTRYRPMNHDLLPALDQKVEEVARECNSQDVANTLWAYATMGKIGRASCRERV